MIEAGHRSDVAIVLNPTLIDFEGVSALLDAVGMRARTVDALERAVQASTDTVIAVCNDKVVGFGRLITDGVYYGSLWDIAVCPSVQGNGVGSQIVQALVGRAQFRGLYMVGLFTDSYNDVFYEKLGFKVLTNVHAMTTLT
jgi:citrate lyase synthetase